VCEPVFFSLKSQNDNYYADGSWIGGLLEMLLYTHVHGNESAPPPIPTSGRGALKQVEVTIKAWRMG
jgi:hypothetical protein